MNDKNLAIITDAWWPQVNGVVNTLMQTRAAPTVLGYQVSLLTPQDHATLPCPGYPEIRLALRPSPRLQARLDEQGARAARRRAPFVHLCRARNASSATARP